MYSQYDEEKYILEHFAGKHPGRFLDIGAYDGKALSNTFALVELGWSGVCIEPSPSVFPALDARFKDNDDIECLQIVVDSETKDAVKFFDSAGDAVSTLSTSHRDKWARANVPFTEVEVPSISFSDLIKKVGIEFEFLNLDVEGTNYDLFLQMPDVLFHRLKCICIEHDNHIAQIKAKLDQFGWNLVYVSDNVLFVK